VLEPHRSALLVERRDCTTGTAPGALFAISIASLGTINFPLRGRGPKLSSFLSINQSTAIAKEAAMFDLLHELLAALAEAF
jgi:hypothetical protein